MRFEIVDLYRLSYDPGMEEVSRSVIIVCAIERGSLTSHHVIGCAHSPFGSYNPGVAKRARFMRPRWCPDRVFIFLISHDRLNTARVIGVLRLLVSGGERAHSSGVIFESSEAGTSCSIWAAGVHWCDSLA